MRGFLCRDGWQGVTFANEFGIGQERIRSGPNYKWLVLATVGLGILTSTVDGSITNIALPELGEVFGVDWDIAIARGELQVARCSTVDPSVILWVSVSYLCWRASG